MKTKLKNLRKFPGWSDAGEEGIDPGLTDNTMVYVRHDGSVAIYPGAGVLVYDYDVTPEWLDWLESEGYLPSRGPGRPIGSGPEAEYTEQLPLVRLTPSQLNQVRARVEESGKTLSEWVRTRLGVA